MYIFIYIYIYTRNYVRATRALRFVLSLGAQQRASDVVLEDCRGGRAAPPSLHEPPVLSRWAGEVGCGEREGEIHV